MLQVVIPSENFLLISRRLDLRIQVATRGCHQSGGNTRGGAAAILAAGGFGAGGGFPPGGGGGACEVEACTGADKGGVELI